MELKPWCAGFEPFPNDRHGPAGILFLHRRKAENEARLPFMAAGIGNHRLWKWLPARKTGYEQPENAGKMD